MICNLFSKFHSYTDLKKSEAELRKRCQELEKELKSREDQQVLDEKASKVTVI